MAKYFATTPAVYFWGIINFLIIDVIVSILSVCSPIQFSNSNLWLGYFCSKFKIFEFVTIPKIIIFIIFLIALDLYSNDAEVISYLLNAYTCRGLDEGLPSVASGCYELGPREN